MLINDNNGVKVRVMNTSVFPKGVIAKIISCEFVGNTTTRAYCIQTDTEIKGLVNGLKSAWYLERDLENVSNC